MRSSLVSVGLIGFSFAPFAACGGSATTTGDGGASAGLSDAASSIASALCARIQACSPFFIQFAYGSEAACASRTTPTLMASLTAAGTGWTASAAMSCAAAIPGASCDDVLGNDVPAACRAPAGQLAVGSACGDGSQCASSYCNLGPGGKCGTCAAALGAVGAACYRDGDCAFGTVCNGASLSATPEVAGQCTALAASGASCDGSRPCAKTLACNAGVCATPLATSATCTPDASDPFGSCNELAGNYCSPTTRSCTPLVLAAAGAPCGTINDALTTCSAGGTCPTPASPSTTCVAPAADFGNCNATAGPGCLSPASCIAGTCVMPTPESCP
jgi:hypothetical protein